MEEEAVQKRRYYTRLVQHFHFDLLQSFLIYIFPFFFCLYYSSNFCIENSPGQSKSIYLEIFSNQVEIGVNLGWRELYETGGSTDVIDTIGDTLWPGPDASQGGRILSRRYYEIEGIISP